MLSGDNSILSRAGQAREKTEYENLKEEAQIVLYGRGTEKTINGNNSNTLKHDLEKGISGNKTVTEIDGYTDMCYVKRESAEITVYDDGEIEEGKVATWDGSSEEIPEFKKENNIWNWYIYTPAQLKFLASFVNNANALTAQQETEVTNAGYNTSDVTIEENQTKVYLMNNLDLGARPISGSTEEQKWETTANEARKWEPIGIGPSSENKIFIGIFEGNNNYIKGVYVNSKKNENGHGLFGNSHTIQNLTIKDSYIKGETLCIGGVVGALRLGKIENCHNENTMVILEEGEGRIVGGVIGQVSSGTQGAYNCTNTGNVIGNSMSSKGNTEAGGVAGRVSTKISNCTNHGMVTGVGANVGGVVGCAGTSSMVIGCYNNGTVTGPGHTGGIIGCANSNSTISECVNSGTVTGYIVYVGGIVGLMSHDDNVTNSTLEKCYNIGEINGDTSVGGVVGLLGGSEGQGTVVECYNKGKVSGTTKVGEVIGNETNKTGLNTVNKLFYKTNTRGLTAIGGEEDNETNKIKGVTDDLTYEQFKTWIGQQ